MSYPQKENSTTPVPPSYEDSIAPHSFESYPTDPAQQPLVTNDGQLVPPAGHPYPMNPSGQPQPGGPIDGTQGYPNQYCPPPDGGYPKQAYQPISNQYTSTTVIATQPTFQPMIVQATIPDYALLSWFSCLCCFWPVGLCAIIKSHEVNSALASNDRERAQRSSSDARRYANISIGIGIALAVFIIALRVIMMMSNSNQ